jgi:hypothetical protein
MVRAVVAALLLVTSSNARAEEMWQRTPTDTGLWISDVCKSEEVADMLTCMSFIRGMNAGQAMVVALGSGKHVYCRPDNVTVEQQRRIVVRQAEQYPQRLHLQSGAFLYEAFSLAFPCPEASANSN